MQSRKRFLIPQLFTFANLSLGIVSLILLNTNNASISALLIILAAVSDRIDGKVARKLHAESDFGKELDSLCDLVSFGVAPALIAWKIGISNITSVWGYVPVLFFVIAGAYRLARFNVNNTPGRFTGLPITAAGTLVVLTVFFNPKSTFLCTFLIILGLLMVSKITFKKV